MNTAQLHVEQVLIGALVLFAGLLPWVPELVVYLEQAGNVVDLVAGATAIGAAYLIGILFDRLADTVTERLERHHRLRFALDRRFIHKCDGWTPGSPWSDPFPEDDYRMRALRQPGPVVAWIDYHRSRLRLSRSMALYLPVVTWCAVVGVGRFRDVGRPDGRVAWIAWLVIFIIWLATVSEKRWMPRGWRLAYAAPRTGSVKARRYAQRAGYLDKHPRSTSARKKRMRTLLAAFGSSPAILGMSFLLVLAVTLAAILDSGRRTAPEVLPTALVGSSLALLAMGCWWRISATYRTYLAQIGSIADASLPVRTLGAGVDIAGE
jgi:hypothetical protein